MRITSNNALINTNPELVNEWHPTKNLIKPSEVSSHSEKKVWWQCLVNSNHIWEAQVNRRARGRKTGCPFCAGRKVLYEESFGFRFPEIANQWDQDLNSMKNPYEFTANSNFKAAWKCDKGHKYFSVISDRTRKKVGCPFCSGHKTAIENSLLVKHPKLSESFHKTKNGDLKPEHLMPHSSKKVWWFCTTFNYHEWQSTVSNRVLGNDCPFCDSKTSINELRVYAEIKYIFPDALHRKKIKKTECDIYIPSLNVAIEYDGFYWHKGVKKHQLEIKKNIFLKNEGIHLIRLRERGLVLNNSDIEVINPSCIGKNEINQLFDFILKIRYSSALEKLINSYKLLTEFSNNPFFLELKAYRKKPAQSKSLADIFPEIAKELDFELNKGLSPENLAVASHLNVWWKCSEDPAHVWQRAVKGRTLGGTGCPYCAGQRPTDQRNLQKLYPELSKEWNHQKNELLKPELMTPRSGKKVWWICRKNSSHEWSATISSRVSGNGCPYCNNKIANHETSLAVLHPEIAKEVHPIKNGDLTANIVVPGSGKNIFWQCENGHEWQAVVRNRVRLKSICPICKKNNVRPDR
jgi:translation initiation factor IF-1